MIDSTLSTAFSTRSTWYVSTRVTFFFFFLIIYIVYFKSLIGMVKPEMHILHVAMTNIDGQHHLWRVLHHCEASG